MVMSYYFIYILLSAESCLDKLCGANEDCSEDAETGEPRCECPRCKDVGSTGASAGQQVCGTDGITYFSRCHLRQAACAQGREDLIIKHQGPCGTKNRLSHTFYRTIKMRKFKFPDRCKSVKCLFGGRCEEGECICGSEHCPEVYEPVCASNGKIVRFYFFKWENILTVSVFFPAVLQPLLP